MIGPGRALATLLVAIAAVSGCAGSRVVKLRLETDLAWPSDAPRVRLLEVYGAQDIGGGLGWLVGSAREPLFDRPYGVAWDGDDLLVADPALGRVIRITSGGTVERSPPDAVAHPISVARCDEGVVVSDSRSGTVALLDRDLARVEWLAEELVRPSGVACSRGWLFALDTGRHRLRVRDAAGRWSTLGGRGGGDGQFNFPTALTIADDTLWVGDTLNFRLQRFDEATSDPVWSDQFGELGDSPGSMPRLKGVAVDISGNIWVSDAHLDRVSLYAPTGELLVSLGGRGEEPGRFSFPAGIAAHPDGRVAVADSLNRRVQIFEVLPEVSPTRQDGSTP